MRATRRQPFETFNVATGDYITVTEIALLALQVLGLTEDTTELRYFGGDRGWIGDVPIVRLSTQRVRGRGWSCGHTSEEALVSSMRAMVRDDALGRLTP
jgi:UDP-glucose 4-epimerase